MDYITVLMFLLLPAVVHEGAHWVAAKLTGTSIKFKFEWSRFLFIPVPRWTWDWPETSKGKLRFICQSGFVCELMLIPVMPIAYQVAALAHFTLYPWYADGVSDFNGM